MMDGKTDVTIALSAEEWNIVLEVLADGRFRLVNPLINKIVQQAQAAEQAYNAAPQANGEDRRPHLAS